MKRLAVILSLLFLPFARGAGEPLRFHTMPDGTYYGGIHSIARDSIGRIWFSGADAVYIYDGERFRSMTERLTSQQPEVLWTLGALVSDPEGRLYLSTNRGLQRFNCAHGQFECIAAGNIGQLGRTDDGTVWFICNGKLCALTGSGIPSGRPAYPPGSSESVLWPLPAGMDPDPRKISLHAHGEHVWIASAGDLYRRESGGEYAHFRDFGNTSVTDVLEAPDTVFVLTLSEGLYVCSPDGEVKHRYTLPIVNDRASTAKQLYRDEEGTIWVATQYGLMLVRPGTGKVSLLRSNPTHPYALPNNSVWSFFPDGEGRVWIGTYGGKLALAVPGDSDVTRFFKAAPGGLGHPIVSCFCEDGKGRIWIGTEGGGITVWDRCNDHFTYYRQQDGSGLASNMVKRLRLAENGDIQAAFFNSGVQVFDMHAGRWKDTALTRGPKDSPLSVYDFVSDGRGGLWLSDPDADLMHATPGSRQVEIIREGARRQVESVFHDLKGRLWILTHNGARQLNPQTGDVLQTLRIDDAPYAVNCLSCALVASSGEILFGTKGAGVNILLPDGSYTNHPMEGRTVFSMEEDPETGQIWMGTDRGLCVRMPGSGTIEPSSLNMPSHCGPFYPRSSFCTRDGELLFGGTDGFIVFCPATLVQDAHRPKVFFNGLRINDQPAPPQDYIAQRSPLPLKHTQSNIAVSFSCDSYLQSWNNRFHCRLRGLSDEWITLPPGQRSVSYFNLAPGSYTLEVTAENSDGVPGEEVASLSWVIRPSPFRTWQAFLVYLLLILGLAFLIWRFFTNRKIYQNTLELEKQRERNMQELTRARMKFFTNISHDLKTPLSLIVDPLRKLKEHLPGDSSANKYADLIDKNVGRMQRMIGQLLTFREIESDRLTLDRRPGDLVSYLESIFSLFEPYADQKGIELLFHSQFETYPAVFDHDVVEKIFTNLFSNAVKYTTVPGSISVNIRPASPGEAAGTAEWISIAVSNTGTGISSERRARLFEAFNHDRQANTSFESSSGLGLAIVKELVNQVGGSVKVESEGAQVIFTITIHLPRTDRPQEDASASYSFVVSEVDALIEELKGKEASVKRPRKSTSVLVIDDDPQLRAYLEEHLSVRYNVYTASDGQEGLEKMEKIHPQVVITDLMMDGADGFAVCRSIRNSLAISHIPVIVLSGDAGNKVKALESGANVFIGKPFEMDYLLSQVDGLLRIQAEMREHYSKKFVAEPAKLAISSMDEALLSRAMEHIERNMDNNDYDVDEFVFDMAVGRTILYRKIKDLTGMSIKEFILDVRLKRAAQLLKDSDLTISEISDRTGFANPKYFSVCFKRRFDISPSDYKKQESPQ